MLSSDLRLSTTAPYLCVPAADPGPCELEAVHGRRVQPREDGHHPVEVVKDIEVLQCRSAAGGERQRSARRSRGRRYYRVFPLGRRECEKSLMLTECFSLFRVMMGFSGTHSPRTHDTRHSAYSGEDHLCSCKTAHHSMTHHSTAQHSAPHSTT